MNKYKIRENREPTDLNSSTWLAGLIVASWIVIGIIAIVLYKFIL